MGSLAAIFQWLQFGQQVIQAGKPALDAVVAAASAHGVQADTDALDAVILDAAKRKAEAEAEEKEVE